MQGAAAAGVVADDAVEDAEGSVGGMLEGVLDGGGVDGFADEGDVRRGVETAADGGRMATSSPSRRVWARVA